jgi:transposase
MDDSTMQPAEQVDPQILARHGFDGFVEGLCESFYDGRMGRPSLPPGTYFLVGYFEGIDSERGIAWFNCS